MLKLNNSFSGPSIYDAVKEIDKEIPEDQDSDIRVSARYETGRIEYDIESYDSAMGKYIPDESDEMLVEEKRFDDDILSTKVESWMLEETEDIPLMVNGKVLRDYESDKAFPRDKYPTASSTDTSLINREPV